MKATCPRLFEVEALRDGRLGGSEIARFQSHLSACSVCKREAEALQALADALRSNVDGEHADDLHVRRERTRLLAAFDAGLLPQAKKRRAPVWLGAAAALVLSLLAAFALVPRSAPREPVASQPATPIEPVTIRADSSAKWSRRSEPRHDTIVLESGALSIRVDHTAASPRRLLVVLPDGELEDIGTTFSVSADEGHTTRVTVQEGSVVLRLHGRAPIALGAGDAWSPPPTSAPPVVAPAVTSPPRAPRPKAGAAPEPPSSSAPSIPRSDAAGDFRAAMSAFNGGDQARAAALFTAFVGEHPGDSRAEDAAYLRVLAHQRAGSASATSLAARDYLTRYPRGFRRAEVEALAR